MHALILSIKRAQKAATERTVTENDMQHIEWQRMDIRELRWVIFGRNVQQSIEYWKGGSA